MVTKEMSKLLSQFVIEDTITLLQWILEESPVDFLGTGSDIRWANKQEQEWKETIGIGIKKLEMMSARNKTGYFPIRIYLINEDHMMICNTPEEVPTNKAFKILRCNVEATNGK